MHYWTFFDYPLATLVHWLQGGVVGFLLSQHQREASLAALVFSILFVVYEATEMWQIHDSAASDIFNFTVCVWVGFLLGHAFRIYWRRRT